MRDEAGAPVEGGIAIALLGLGAFAVYGLVVMLIYIMKYGVTL